MRCGGTVDDFFIYIGVQNTIKEVLELTHREVARLGVCAGTLHVTLPHTSQVGPSAFIGYFGHDAEWMREYRKADVRRHDPVPDYVMLAGRGMTYAEAIEKISLSPQQQEFVDRISQAGLLDMMALPIYGPFDFDTFATLHIGRPFVIEEDRLMIERIVAVLEATNRRLGQLAEGGVAEKIGLSERETEVLKWMGQSKSNGDIATILTISIGTVDTYVRRIFAKLGTNDRIAAVLKGVRLGLIRF